MTLSVEPEAAPIRLNPDGVALVGDTRVPLDTVIGEFNDGATPEEIVRNFDTLALADVYATIAYYMRRRGEVDAYLREQERRAERMRMEYLRRFPQEGLREKLLQRMRERTVR